MANEKKKNTFTITLADGTQITDLGLTGNCFISEKPITVQDFSGKLKNVVISCSDEEYRDKYNLVGSHDYMELLSCEQSNIEGYEGKYLFVLRGLTRQEVRDIEIDARLDYHEMMLEA
ncbi:MAG: hypothetical protein IJ859_00125 [Synergistaceae bacterium]|nr:hypothetical protein [Synergistaceae bacterium]